MYTFTHKFTRSLLALVLAIGGLALTRSHASAATPVFDLCAMTGTLAPLPVTAPLTTVPIWGFGLATAELGDFTPDCSTVTSVSLPGPLLDVGETDFVTIKVKNALPAGHTISFEIPGISFDVGPTDAAVGATVTRTFTASDPGTYLYQSGGDAGRQEAMGLYGALIVRSGTSGQAYDDVSTAYDGEATLVLSQIDPNFNAAPDTFDMKNYLATYWLINGKAYPDTATIPAPTGLRRLLLRYVNAGYDNTTMALLGMHEQVLARDANLLNNPFLANAETIPTGGTEDAIVTVPSSGAGSGAGPNGFALYNRQLHVTNGSPASGPGGMLTFITP